MIRAPIIYTMAYKEVKGGGLQGNTEYTVLPNVALWTLGLSE
jgi:hypothetical protein